MQTSQINIYKFNLPPARCSRRVDSLIENVHRTKQRSSLLWIALVKSILISTSTTSNYSEFLVLRVCFFAAETACHLHLKNGSRVEAWLQHAQSVGCKVYALPAFQDYYTKVMSESGFIADIYCCAINFAFELSLALWRGSRIWHPVSFRARIAKRVPGNLVSYSAHNPFSISTFKSAAPLSAARRNILSRSQSVPSPWETHARRAHTIRPVRSRDINDDNFGRRHVNFNSTRCELASHPVVRLCISALSEASFLI